MAGLPGGFPRSHRLTRPSDFRRVFKDSRRSSDSLFLVLARPNALQHARLGCTLSRRRLAKAVARNRVRRLIRESFRRCLPGLKGFDIVVLAQRDISAVPNRKLTESLDRHWMRIAAWEKSSSS